MSMLQVMFPDGRVLYLNLNTVPGLMFHPAIATVPAVLVLWVGGSESIELSGADAEMAHIAIMEGLLKMADKILEEERNYP